MAERENTVVRVMIVEDDLGSLERFAGALVRDPRTRVAEKARSGREAIARLPDVSPDVLLVDLGLPDIHGTEVIRFAARTLPECDIMVITVFGDERNVIASIEAGATGYVLKDCSDADLVARVLELRAGGSPMSPGIARMVLTRMRASTGAAPAPRKRDGSADENAPFTLTSREADVLRLLSRGYMYAEIGDRLGISVHTVTSHIKNSYRKLAVHSAAAAVTRAADLHLLDRSKDNG
jgi:DNA-binding NarL/FixJ family response regulator